MDIRIFALQGPSRPLYLAAAKQWPSLPPIDIAMGPLEGIMALATATEARAREEDQEAGLFGLEEITTLRPDGVTTPFWEVTRRFSPASRRDRGIVLNLGSRWATINFGEGSIIAAESILCTIAEEYRGETDGYPEPSVDTGEVEVTWATWCAWLARRNIPWGRALPAPQVA